MNLRDIITRDDPTIIEIGANIGTDTLVMSDTFPNGKIYCFEPDPDVYLELSDNANTRNNIYAYRLAIAETTGKKQFYRSNQKLSGSLHVPIKHLEVYPNVSFTESIEVNTMSLDDFVRIRYLDIIDFVWADVQGAEVDMITGGINTFTNKVRYLFTEFSKVELYKDAPNLNKILELLPSYEVVEVPWQWEYDGNVLLRNNNL